jgi:hypothetical protein
MRRARPLLGTIVDISAEDAPETLPDAIEAAFASIEAVQRLMSFHDPDSEVSQIKMRRRARWSRSTREHFTSCISRVSCRTFRQERSTSPRPPSLSGAGLCPNGQRKRYRLASPTAISTCCPLPVCGGATRVGLISAALPRALRWTRSCRPRLAGAKKSWQRSLDVLPCVAAGRDWVRIVLRGRRKKLVRGSAWLAGSPGCWRPSA